MSSECVVEEADSMTVKKIYFVRNRSEYRLARNAIASSGCSNSIILTIDSRSPFIKNKYSGSQFIVAWEEMGIVRPNISRHWIVNYKQIEPIIRDEIREEYGETNEMMLSSNFIMGVVPKVGQQYYQYISILKSLFSKHAPSEVRVCKSDDFITDLIIRVAAFEGIACKWLTYEERSISHTR